LSNVLNERVPEGRRPGHRAPWPQRSIRRNPRGAHAQLRPPTAGSGARPEGSFGRPGPCL